jgi:hypothetical protein
MEYCCDLDIGHPWVLKDVDYFKNLTYKPEKDNHFQVDLDDLTDDFKNWAVGIGYPVIFAELFYRPPRHTCEIHADVVAEASNAAKLNWVYHTDPDLNIVNPKDEKSTMIWYESTTQFNRKNYANPLGQTYTIPKDESLCRPVYSHEIKTPSLVNVSKLHNIVNSTNYQRWCLSIVFSDPSPELTDIFLTYKLARSSVGSRLDYDKFKEILSPWITKTDI